MLFNMLGYMLISSFTPGPGNILALNTMVNYGWKKGRRLVLGIGIGYLVVQYICTLAVYFLSTYLNNAMVYIKYLGAVYLIWLALHIALSKKYEQNNKKEASFTVGFFMQLVNVKIYFLLYDFAFSIYYSNDAGYDSSFIDGTFCCIYRLHCNADLGFSWNKAGKIL